MIKIAIADDHQLFREGIKFLIDQMTNISTICEAGSHQELFDCLATQKVDLILMDLEMPEMEAADALRKINSDFPDIKVIILTMFNDIKMMSYLMELGVNSYLVKDTNSEELQKAIETVYQEDYYIHPHLATALLYGIKSKQRKRPTVRKGEAISEREKEVLEMICQGLTAKEIAEKLFISQRTAEGHRKRLLAKFDVKNTASLIVKAIKMEIVTI